MTNPDELIVNNVGLIYMVLKEMNLTSYGDEIFEEAYSDGMIGLIRGARRYDPSKGYKADTYLVHCIRSWIRRGIRRRNYLCNKVNYLPSNLSLDMEYGDELDSMIFSNIIPDNDTDVEQEAFRKIRIDSLQYAMEKCLNEKERNILYHNLELFGHKFKSYTTLGKEYGVSREWIHQISRRALKKLKAYMLKHNCYEWAKKEVTASGERTN